MREFGFLTALLFMLVSIGACDSVDDERIPSVPVSLNLASTPLWDTYGVSAFGEYKIFIKSMGVPSDFPYSEKTYTGYGGLLIVCGVNPFTVEAGVPMVYDLSCPVECKPDIRVEMHQQGAVAEAVCPVCGSHYDVVELGGAPLSGPAYKDKFGLRRYEARPGAYGGYLFTDL
ncbi:MAG: hypothetical protein K2G67_02730 [Muribaculaceae bacterium]|nr:hypothetical protein [Muribaculaceae bacterium]